MPLLRTITLLGKTVAQSVEAFPCTLVDFDANLVSGSGTIYVQFFNKATAAVNGDIPVKSFVFTVGTPPQPLMSIFQLMGPISFSLGLSIGISTTESTYTAATATFDLFIDIEEATQDVEAIPGLSLVSASSNVILQIFATASFKRIFKIQITAGEGVTVYPMIFQATAIDGTYPMFSFPALADGLTKNYYFGANGLSLPNGDQSAILVLSTTSPVLTRSTGLGSTLSAKVKA